VSKLSVDVPKYRYSFEIGPEHDAKAGVLKRLLMTREIFPVIIIVTTEAQFCKYIIELNYAGYNIKAAKRERYHAQGIYGPLEICTIASEMIDWRAV